jgi:small subunit ribosomal protein S18
MARNPKVGKKAPQSKPRLADGKGRVRRGRPKVCRFCAEHLEWVDYKDVNLLRRFMNDRGRIRARGATGTCAQHQRDVAVAIKTARELALLPYAVRTVAADPGDRRGGGRRVRDQAATSGEAAAPEADEADETDVGSPDQAASDADGAESAEPEGDSEPSGTTSPADS